MGAKREVTWVLDERLHGYSKRGYMGAIREVTRGLEERLYKC